MFRYLKFAALTVLIGRAYQHFFWDVPYRSLFWDESLLGRIVPDWTAYVRSPETERMIIMLGIVSGVVFLQAAILVASIGPRFAKKLSYLKVFKMVSFLLAFLAFCYWKDKFYQIGELMEYALQVGAPLFFIWAVQPEKKGLETWMLAATAITFVGHGLYAVGFHPRPGHFSSMVINAFGIGDAWAGQFLTLMGVLDFVAAAMLFLPGKWKIPALWYCVVWGFVTAFARLWVNFFPEFWMESLHQWFYEFLYRGPHFLVPLALLVRARGSRPD